MNKKEKFENWVKYADSFIDSKFIFIFLVSYVLMALFKDLNLEYAFRVISSIWLCCLVGLLCAFITIIICLIIKKYWAHKDAKKSNIEKLIDEEIKKGEN